MRFTIDPAAHTRIPNPVICLYENVEVRHAKKCKMHDAPVAEAMTRLAEIKDRLLGTPEVQGFRKLYPATPAGERLLASVERKGQFPRYNNLVDAVNLGSLTEITPIGFHDARCVAEETEICLRLAEGSERLIPSFQTAEKTIPAGEVTYGILKEKSFTPFAWLGTEDVDNRDFQIQKDTTRCIVTVIGHHDTSLEHNIRIARKIEEFVLVACPSAKMRLFMPEVQA